MGRAVQSACRHIECQIDNAARYAARCYQNHPHYDDLVQAGRLRAWQSLPRFDPRKANLFTWLCASSRAGVRHYLSRKAPVIHVPEYLPDDAGPELLSLDAPDYVERTGGGDINLDALAVKLLVDALPARQRAVIYGIADGLSQVEIAAKIGVTQMTVSRDLDRARNRVRLHLMM